jgi:hypothetical protein
VKRPLLLSLASLVFALAAQVEVGSAWGLSLRSQGFQLSGANTKTRLTVHCPGKLLPYAGGMTGDPIAADGSGLSALL